MTQPTNAISGFFAGGGRAAKFPTIGTTITGTITAVHPPEPQRDFETGQDIPGKTQVRIELDTDLRDPDIDNDDGSRTLYVRGWMTGAIGDALRKAAVKEPAAGGRLSITYIKDGPPSRPGLNGPKLYTAEYSPPGTAATQQFFDNGSEKPPAGIDPKVWADMPEEAKRAIQSMKGAKVVNSEPPF